MSSIGSTLNSINSSLLSEISSATLKAGRLHTGGSKVGGSSPSDQVDLSQVSDLFKQLNDLKSSDPAKFKQILADASAKFKDAASQTNDSGEVSFLNQLSDQFKKASETGELSSLQPPSAAHGSYGPSGHSQAQSAYSTGGNSELQQLLDLLKNVQAESKSGSASHQV